MKTLLHGKGPKCCNPRRWVYMMTYQILMNILNLLCFYCGNLGPKLRTNSWICSALVTVYKQVTCLLDATSSNIYFVKFATNLFWQDGAKIWMKFKVTAQKSNCLVVNFHRKKIWQPWIHISNKTVDNY